jgi:Fic family protein
MPYRRDKPYNDLPLLPPAAEIETVRTLKRAIAANKALAELKYAGNLIPNQTMLLRSIVLQEAKLSSEIENIVTTNDMLYKAMSDDDSRVEPHTKEVLRYETALWEGFKGLGSRALATNLYVDIVNCLKRNDSGIRKHSGTRIANPATDQTIYTPPEGETVIRDLLQNLDDYVNDEKDSTDPLIKLAVIHYQFEAIHPFADGNGRTGRILNILYLVDRKLLETPVLYLSRYIIENKAAYYSGLRRVTEEHAWEGWIVYMLDAIEATARATRDRILAIRRQMDEATDFARNELPRVYSKELIELIFQQPYCRIQAVEQAGIAKRQTASTYLKELERIGLLRGVKVGRDQLYINDQLYGLLTG